MTQVRKQRRHSRGYYAKKILREVWAHPSNETARVRGVLRSLSWQAFKRVVRRPIRIPVFGHSVARIYPDSTSGSNLVYFRRGYIDPAEMAFMHRYLRSGDQFIDLGANIGTYTLLAAEIVGPNGHVYAFEPHPLSCERLRENVELNGLRNIVSVFDVAVSAARGEVPFLLDWDVSNRIAGPADEGKRTVLVPARTLDSLLPASTSVAMAKLDVEGAEVDALRGASVLMAAGNPPVWLVEITSHLLEKMGTSAAELLRTFREAGYRRLAEIPGGSEVADAIGALHPNNHIFVHAQRAHEVIARAAEGA